MKYEKFKKQWLDSFASPLYKNPRDKFLIHAEQYIWHLFSWGYLPKECYLERIDAMDAFDSIPPEEKENAIFFERFGKNMLSFTEHGKICSDDLEECIEIYVVAKDFSWTYIKTHEGYMCGPYYCDKELLSRYFEKGAFNDL